MEKLMRNAPTVAVLVVMIIQVKRVSDFGGHIGAGILAWVFAVFLAFVIYVLSYWFGRTKYQVTADRKDPKQAAKYSQQKRMARIYGNARIVAGFWLFLFVLIEGTLNLSETMRNLPTEVTGWEEVGAVVYGVFPTLAAFGLGTMQALIDRIPNGPAAKSGAQALYDSLMQRIAAQSGAQDAKSADDAAHNAKPSAKNAPQSDAYPKTCPHGCGAQLQNAAQYSAHVGRWCEVVQAKNALNANSAQVAVELPKQRPIDRMNTLTATATTAGETGLKVQPIQPKQQ